MEEVCLLNKNYMHVLDIMGKPFKTTREVKQRYNKVNRLTCKFISEQDLNEFISCFNATWNTLPKEFFDIKNIEDLNLRINQFAKYSSNFEDQFKDHGYSLVVVYYLKACNTYLNNIAYNISVEDRDE